MLSQSNISSYANAVAADILKSRNPSGWNGEGNTIPKTFSIGCKMYDLPFDSSVSLTVCLHKEPDPKSGKMLWCHSCQLIDKRSWTTLRRISEAGISSVKDIAQTIEKI